MKPTELLDLSLSGIVSSLIFGAIGLWVFKTSKKESDIIGVVLGLALMLYTYFTSGPLADWGVGFLLWGGYWYHRRYGF